MTSGSVPWWMKVLTATSLVLLSFALYTWECKLCLLQVLLVVKVQTAFIRPVCSPLNCRGTRNLPCALSYEKVSLYARAWLCGIAFPYRPWPSSQGLPSECRQILRRSQCFRAAAQGDSSVMGTVMQLRGPSGGGCPFQSASHSDEHVVLCTSTACKPLMPLCTSGQSERGRTDKIGIHAQLASPDAATAM